MNNADRIKSLVKEADIYRDQGLLEQAKYKYSEALILVQNNSALQKQESLINTLNKRIKAVEATLDDYNSDTDEPQLTEEVQNLISSLFSFSGDKDIAAIEGAVALAKFGQYEKAFTEFQRLIDERILPLKAAQNMLMCQLFFISPERAVDQYRMWVSTPIFTEKELKSLRGFMITIFKKEGIELDLPEIQTALPEESRKDILKEPVLELSSIGICMKDKFQREIDIDLDITFQTGNTVSFFVKANKRQLIDFLATGTRLSVIQCHSSSTFFQARGVVSDRKLITSGPRTGDYIFDLSIEKI
jgi:tetratricopeptide (TPR) repeat protein